MATAESPRYKVSRKVGVDVVHVEHPWEQCNTDTAANLDTVDEATARALISRGDARQCEHCQPFAEAS